MPRQHITILLAVPRCCDQKHNKRHYSVEQYVEMHPEDAKILGIKDGDKVRLVTRRGNYEAKAQVGTNSLVKPARNSVPRGYVFSPWNLSVADSADPKKNRWLVNNTSSRVWDLVSGQVDFKKLACRIEKV